jgi:phage shock protein A
MKTSPLSPNGVVALCFLTGTFPANAFLAPHPNLKTNSAAPAVLPPSLPTVVPPLSHFRSARSGSSPNQSSMALHANLVDRFFRITRGNLNSILSKFEDPEKVMDQALIDMQNDIVKIRQTYAEVTAGQRRLLSQKNQFEAVADDWYRRAQLALKSNNEGLAREALARREQALQKATSIQQQVDSQANNLDKLYEGMTALESKITEAQTRKSELASRAKTAKSTAWVNDMLSGLSGQTSMDAFRRMEDKVAALEATAEVSTEILNNSLLTSVDTKSSKMDVEMEFRRLEASDAVDREFQKLKQANLLPASERKKEEIRIPVTSTERITVPILD